MAFNQKNVFLVFLLACVRKSVLLHYDMDVRRMTVLAGKQDLLGYCKSEATIKGILVFLANIQIDRENIG